MRLERIFGWVLLLVKVFVILCYLCLSNIPTLVKSLLVKLLVIFLIRSYHLFIK